MEKYLIEEFENTIWSIVENNDIKIEDKNYITGKLALILSLFKKILKIKLDK